MLLAALAVAALSVPAAQPDTMLDVGGYRLHLVVHRGTAPLTIIMESGGGASLESWSGVDSVLARRTGATVVAYDRAGFGRSELGPADLPPERQVAQLSDALDRLGTPNARLVVGTSYGGVLALLHAHLYPGRVRGLALVDPMNARFVRATGDFVFTTVSRIERPVTRWDSAQVRMIGGFRRLIAGPAGRDAELRLPIAVVTAGEPWWGKPDVDRAWRASHEAIAGAGRDRRLIMAEGSKHDVPGSRPDTIVEAVLWVARSAGTGH